MAGDTYSFIIDNFQEENIGRYSITAENQSGKATCSAEIIFEGSEFSNYNEDDVPIEAIYTEEIITRSVCGESELISETKTFNQSSSKTVSTESKSIETVPLLTRDLSIQSILIPETRDVSSQSQSMSTKETGIQIKTDVSDKSSQIETVRTRDESSQWHMPEIDLERVSNVGHGSAPFVSTKDSHFSSSNVDESTITHSYSYTQESVAYNSTNLGGTETTTTTTTTTIPNSDFSTTLIKDVNPHYEPVELIINRSDTIHPTSSSTYIREVENFHHRPLHRFEPVNLIFQKPHSSYSRSGSLPPLISRINFKSSATRSDFDHTDTEDDSSYYYYSDRYYDNRENYSCYSKAESKMTYYKEVERRNQRPAFKPVELILDASSLSDSGKRYRDTSLPTMMSKRIRMPIKHQNLITSSFIYDNNYDYYDYDSTISDFISDRAADERESRYRYAAYKTANYDDREQRTQK